MTSLPFFIRVALNNLLHGGQRVLVAVLCVAFGVMSLVSMTLLSGALERMLVEEPQDLIGADISMDRLSEDFILPEHVEGLEALRQENILSEYTLVAYTSSLTFRLPNSGELHFPGAGIGIEPAAYPPIGELTVAGLESVGLPTLLQEVGDVLVSRDLALEHNLAVGDSLVLSDLTVGAPLIASIRGIIVDTPNHKGSKLYYSLETASQLAGGKTSLNTVLATAPDPEAAQVRLETAGWRAFLATRLADGEEQVQELFAFMLNGAGVLGLLVGGVGIANTMQVLLRRRRREVAIWKCIGYRSSQLMVLFALEAGLLGLTGSLLGATLGVAISAGLVNLFSRTSTMLIRWALTPAPVFLAILVGVVTTVIFALWAIVSTSRVRPVALLRSEPSSAAGLPWFQALGLLLVLALPFTAVISLVMGSPLKGIGVLAVALTGLAGLGGMLAVLLWLVVRLLPLRSAPLLNMARGNLRRRGLAPVFALIALFVGVVSLAAASLVTQNANRVMDEVSLNIEGENLTILAPAGQAADVEQALAGQVVESQQFGYATRVRAIHRADNPQETFSPLLVGRSQPVDYQVFGAPWGSRPDGVYVTRMAAQPEDSLLAVTLWDGSVREVPVVGTYQVNAGQMFRPELGILMTNELSESIVPPEQVQYMVRVPSGRLSAAARELGAALPGATVINLVTHAARFTSQYHNLFVLAVSMASLALLAGMLLMANSVSLAMLDRRYEIGVLKSMGYARRHVLVTLVVEYALIAAIACGAGLGVVRGFLWLVELNNELVASLMVLTPAAAGAVAAATFGLTLLTVLAVTWKPSQVSPLVVLSDRE